MKILMTGFTPRGVGSQKLLYEYMSNTSVIVKMLRAAGHEIDHRIVDVDDTSIKDKYDVAMVALAVPQSLSSRFVFGALWTAEQFGIERTRFFVDDWLLHQFASQLESALREPQKRFYSLDNRHCYEAAQKYTDVWMKWYKRFLKEPTKLLIPAFAWAKPRTLLPKLDKIQPVIFDPTPLALTDPEVFWGSKEPMSSINPLPMSERKKQWTLAAMRDVEPWFKKQAFGWPVERYGNKRQGHEILTERDLVQRIYTTNAGIIGAPYALVAGGGGWRARYVHSAITRSILFLDSDEARTAGQSYNLFRTKIEKASDQELTDIAEAQREHLITKTWNLAQLTEQLDTYVKTGDGVR